MTVTTSQIDLLSRLLDAANMRHDVIAQNVANVNTPGYRQNDVQFEDAFSRALASGQDAAAMHVEPKIVAGKGGIERADGNNVDIDMEMGRLNKNSLLFKVYAQLMALQLNQLRSAISGR